MLTELWIFIEHNMKKKYVLTVGAIPLSNLFKYKRESVKNTEKNIQCFGGKITKRKRADQNNSPQ